MNPGLFGAISAGALGTADFMGRFSTRALDQHNALLGVLSVGVALLTIWMVVTGRIALPHPDGYVWLTTNGVATTVMTLLLYLGLARGPVSVVAPIVAAHPVLVVLFYFASTGQVPGALALAAMTVTVVGTVIVARSAEGTDSHVTSNKVDGLQALRKTTLIAVGSSFAYAVLIIAGQAAAPTYGELATLWYGRIASLAALLALFAVRREVPHIPLKWWPFLGAQGLLDACGYIALFAGSLGQGRDVVAVVASTFGAVTVLLARVVLKERIRGVQWLGICLVFIGVVTLSLRT
jgi:uncharacterized membrane protein